MLSGSLLPLDKQEHIIATALVSSSVNIYAREKTSLSKIDRRLLAVGSAMYVGLSKEFFDEGDYGGFSRKDIVADLIGSVAGVFFSDMAFKVIAGAKAKRVFLKISHSY